MKYVFNLSNTQSQSASNTHAGQFGGLGEGTRSNGHHPTQSDRSNRCVYALQLQRCQDANAERSVHRKTIYTFFKSKHYLW